MKNQNTQTLVDIRYKKDPFGSFFIQIQNQVY